MQGWIHGNDQIECSSWAWSEAALSFALCRNVMQRRQANMPKTGLQRLHGLLVTYQTRPSRCRAADSIARRNPHLFPSASGLLSHRFSPGSMEPRFSKRFGRLASLEKIRRYFSQRNVIAQMTNARRHGRGCERSAKSISTGTPKFLSNTPQWRSN